MYKQQTPPALGVLILEPLCPQQNLYETFTTGPVVMPLSTTPPNSDAPPLLSMFIFPPPRLLGFVTSPPQNASTHSDQMRCIVSVDSLSASNPLSATRVHEQLQGIMSECLVWHLGDISICPSMHLSPPQIVAICDTYRWRHCRRRCQASQFFALVRSNLAHS